MLVTGPAAQHAPQGRENATEPGRATEHAIEESDPGIGGTPNIFQVRHFRSQQIVKAEGDQQQADTCSQEGAVSEAILSERRTPRTLSIARLSASASLSRDVSLAAFTINISVS